jgi:hypothetical protein
MKAGFSRKDRRRRPTFLTKNSRAMSMVEQAGLLAWSILRHWRKSHRWIGVAARSTVFVYNKTTQSVQPCCIRCSTLPVPSRRDAGQPHRRVVFRRRRGQVRPVRGRDLESNGRVSGRTHFRKVRRGSWTLSIRWSSHKSDLDGLRACVDYVARRDPQWAIVRTERCDSTMFSIR